MKRLFLLLFLLPILAFGQAPRPPISNLWQLSGESISKTPANNDAVIYDSTLGKWKNGAGGGGGGGTPDSDTAFGSSWNGVTTIGPSKNAVYDEIHLFDTADNGTIINAGTGFRIGGIATSRKLLIGNGTNFVASTETYAVPGTSGNVLTSDGTNWTSAALGANPTATIGLAAVNGSATTFLRSDGAPPLGQSITPTWTGKHTYSEASTIASGASAVLDDVNLSSQITTVTGGTHITTAKGFNKVSIYGPTYTDSTPVTIDAGATLYIESGPVASGSVTLTRGYALWVDIGTVRFDNGLTVGGINAPSTGVINAGTGFTINDAAPASGRILIGDGTTYVNSAVTYPNSSGTSGKLIQSNGTNFTTSTMTWPSGTAPTSRKIVVSDGTNMVASTETYAVPGTSGNVHRSDGTNWLSAALAAADLSNGVTGSGAVVLAVSPALTGNPTAPTQASTDNSTNVATTAYVTTGISNGIAASNPAVAVQAATTAAADTSSYVYANGVAGIGATLTGPTNNVAVVFDGFTFTAVGQRALVKNDTQSPSGAFNGMYTLTVLQGVGIKPVLTRALDFDQSSDINNTGVIPVVNGTVNTDTEWLVTSSVTTVGTDPITFTQFSLNPTTIVNAIAGENYLTKSGNTITANAVALGGTNVSGQLPLARMDTSTSTANKVLMSGASSAPSWSTPTFPNASATSGKFIRSDGTNWIASTPTLPTSAGTAGKVLRSDGTNYVESTPTYPNASGSSGVMLVSDGTNFVTTTPTYPTAASPTSRKIMVADGTNWTASTETWAVPSTAGKTLQSDGTNWISNAPATARNSSNLNIDEITGHGDSIYTIVAGDRIVATNAAFTASRTWTLPASSACNAGQALTIMDQQGTLTTTNTLQIARAGSDTMNGGTANLVLSNAFASITLVPDGVSKWTTVATSQTPDIQQFTTTGSGTWTKPVWFTPRVVRVICVGGGGGGGAGGSTTGAVIRMGGAGGGGGDYDEVTYAATDLGATESVSVGVGGTAGVTGGSGAIGGDGGNGGDSTFGTTVRLRAGGGGGGRGGAITAAAGGGGGGGGLGATGGLGGTAAGLGGGPGPGASQGQGFKGADGGTGTGANIATPAALGGGGGGGHNATPANGPGGTSFNGGAGGGCGTGTTAVPALVAGSAGGDTNVVTTAGGGGGAVGTDGASPTAGTAGTDGTSVKAGKGGGGGGGTITSNTAGAAGGAGGAVGGGGGGGGCGTNTGGGGGGGLGGKGTIWVYSW